MENSSGQEKPRLEPNWLRPPGLDFGQGIAICSLVFAVFVFAQNLFFSIQVISLTPELHDQSFTMDLLRNQLYQNRVKELLGTAAVIAPTTLYTDLVATAVLLIFSYQWKRRGIVDLLGLRLPNWRSFLAWTGLFIGVFAMLEVAGMFVPQIRSQFMDKIASTMTNVPLMLLSVGIMAPIFEELLLRGLLFKSLRYVMEKHSAVALTAGIFTLMHLQYDWILMLVYVLPMGVILGYARANTGSVWTSVFLHLVNNCLSVLVPHLL